MSTPVGQSDAQPLQARQRSSASATAGSANPCTSDPSIASCSTRERPRVESFSSRVARYDGHITPLVDGATHLPTPVQRCTASPSLPPSCGELQQRQRPAPRPDRPQVGVERRRVDQVAGVEQVARVADRLDRREEPERLLVVHQRQQLGAGPAVAVLAGQRAAVVAQLERAGGEEVAEDLRRADLARLEGEVDPHVHAAVAEVAVGHAVEVVLLEQLVEVAQPGAQPVRRDRGVLPAGVRRASSGCARPGRRRPRGSARARPPRRRRSPAGARARRSPRSRPWPRAGASAPTTSTNSQPAPFGSSGTAPPRARTRSTIRASSPSQAIIGAVGGREQRRDGVGRLDHRRVAEHRAGAVWDSSSTSRTVASRTSASVPSEPTRNRSTLRRSRAAGARASSR